MSRYRMDHLISFFISLTLSLLLTLVSAPSVHAGNGSFESGAFNFCASVRFNATTSQLNQIRTAFQNGSDVLLDATDGQHRFGRITIVNDSGASQSAEYWVNPGSGRAFASHGKYGFRGEHVNLFFNSDFQAAIGADGDAYTIAHEHVHHAYGVLDEYSGPAGPAEDAPLPDTATLNYSIMDNYFTRGGRAFGSNYTLNEFCVSTNHDPDRDTWQEDQNGESVWETVASQTRFPAIAPAGLPVDAPPASQPVTFVDGFGGLRAMLLIDRSGSMSVNERLDFAKLGAKQFVDLMQDGDGLGVASFATLPSVDFALATVTDTVRNAAKSAIDSLEATGLTNIGGGLLTALGQLTSQSDRSCNEVIVLLSDGDHNTGTPPSAAIPTLQSENVTVLTIGVGSGLSTSGEATLQNVASQTGGRFFRVANPSELTNVFIQLSAETSGSGILARAPEMIESGDTLEVDILVEPGVSAAVFALTKDTASDDISLSLRTPLGDVITIADASDPDVNVITSPNSIIFEISGPDDGVWQMIGNAATVTNGQVDFLAFARHDGVQLNLSVKDTVVVFPEAVIISATPLFEGAAVVGALIEGTVRRPDGSRIPITLLDDGLGPDTIPGDGIYAATFSRYNDDGTYIFDLTATVNGANTFSGEDIFISADHPSSSQPVPDFVRIASATAVVTGVPEFIVATVEFGPETINLKSMGKWITAYIELPEGFSPEDIVVDTVEITAIDGVALPVSPIPSQAFPTKVGDFDNDGIPDLMVKFDRQQLQEVLSPGVRTIQLEGLVAGQLFIGERSVGVINPGR